MPKGVRCKYDWVKLRREYVTGTDSFDDLCRRYGASKSAVYKRSKSEGWVSDRREYRKKISAAAVEKATKREIGKLDRLLNAADNMASILEELSDGSHRFMSRTYVQAPDGESMEMIETINARDIRDFATAVRDIAYTLRNIYDIPTAAQRQKMRIEEERWAIEKKALEAQVSQDANRIDVVVAGELEDYTV